MLEVILRRWKTGNWKLCSIKHCTAEFVSSVILNSVDAQVDLSFSICIWYTITHIAHDDDDDDDDVHSP